MAIIIVEDGSIVEDANSYVSVADLQQYIDDRGIVIDTDLSQLLIQSMDYIESLNYLGKKSTEEQPLQWPRKYVYIDGYKVADDTIPNQLKLGQMATAVATFQGNSPLNPIAPAVKREQVDTLVIEYQDGAGGNTIDPTINRYLNKLIYAGYGMNQFRVSKA